ncbi:baculoviral IAP repeat-containing protein 3 [Apis florea]|uniref:baculoviral IAP repeat-containing protein 3 n=1 Tax=Apis florea TaxID=7463 RepID=UPI000629966D|nr:baculoviral IAP repeat-containing protein 3 [Apis florea]
MADIKLKNFKNDSNFKTATNAYLTSPIFITSHISNDEIDNIDYHFEIARLQSFKNWPVSYIEPKKLAAAGFYYTGECDKVRCFECQVEICQWVRGDIPMVDHEKWSAKCRFICKINCGNVPIDPNTMVQPRSSSYLEHQLTSSVDDYSTELQLPRIVKLSCLNLEEPKKPAYPEYGSYDARLNTFSTWPSFKLQTKEQLADAGFYYTGKDDQTICYYCACGLRDWEPEDKPWEQHAKWFPKCYYLLMVKGQDYVNKITGQHIPSPSTQETRCTDSNSESSYQNNSIEPSISNIESITENMSNRKVQNNKSADDARICKICYNEELEVVFLPCGHVISCVKCSCDMKSCAICRKLITKTVRIFFS